MGRALRTDAPGEWHHVMNRGQAGRPVFETGSDCHDFLARAASLAIAGSWEVHAYCLLTNHFHLLVRSRDGQLPRHMAWLQCGFVRAFNRRRDRDGALFRGRYVSKPIGGQDETYWRAVIRYIDHNPVAAGLSLRASEYPWGSAFHYARPAGPSWLTRSRVEGAVADTLGLARFQPGCYEDAFGPYAAVAVQGIDGPAPVKGRRPPGSAADLIGLATPEAALWLEQRAILADGRFPRRACVDGALVQRAVESARSLDPGCEPRGRRWQRSWARVETGMLRTLSGCSQAEVARRIGRSPADVSTLEREDQARRKAAEPHHRRRWRAAIDAMSRE
ncbi:MAG: transposase [Planctomycetes bacterium]|nr:transposase [Planctomycetota bacterium]